MDKRLVELLPYMRRLRHLHELGPDHVKKIDDGAKVVAFIRKKDDASLLVGEHGTQTS